MVERRFATDRLRGNAMLEAAGINDANKKLLWAEAVRTACKVGTLVPDMKGNSSYEKFYGQPPKLTPYYFVEFGRIGYIAMRKMQEKSKPKARKHIMIGYAEQHSPDVYKMFNPFTRSVIFSRNVKWGMWIRHDTASALPIYKLEKLLYQAPQELNFPKKLQENEQDQEEVDVEAGRNIEETENSDDESDSGKISLESGNEDQGIDNSDEEDQEDDSQGEIEVEESEEKQEPKYETRGS